ncbi:toll/interleukin-1 receptor domain-containing protein [Rhodoferax ferrireducens]|uniref:toll/interleukin-1 receptor domain-containing protein n=1 Tax=Rhodoferax ferrireducens TaxID=192843 RepID=UPI000E0DBFD2|nr:toll/interleukin-1 receptor domain-containing protein [Rhodoferax ferrireducens]
MPYSADEFAYGPVVILRGKHKGRIGELDDDTIHKGKLHGIVKFAPFGITAYYSLIPLTYLQAPNTQQLLARHEQLFNMLTPYRGAEAQGEERILALEELAFVSGVLNDRMFTARFSSPPHGAMIFLSHASADKGFVRGLAVDLGELGHQPWLDEWEILGGESIPTKIAEGLDQADFVVVVLSEHAVASRWVEQEWQAKFWAEVNERKVTVIPILLNDCTVPTLLRTKKYIDFRHDYTEALEELVGSISRHLKR